MTSFSLARTTFCLLAIVGAVLTASCGGWVPESPAPLDAPIIPLSTEEAAGEYQLPTRQGVTPCGVFDVNGFGHKVVMLADFPACAAHSYQVYCLDRIGQWRAAHVTAVSTDDASHQVTFTSAQEGTCGLFPR